MEIKINKEIREYKENIVLGLNLRQFVFSIGAVACSAGSHDKKTISGFLYVKADYPAEVALIGGTLTLTYWYSGNGMGNIAITTSTSNTGNSSSNDGSSFTGNSGKSYDDYDCEPVPQTGDMSANIPLIVTLSSGILATGIAFIRKKLMGV